MSEIMNQEINNENDVNKENINIDNEQEIKENEEINRNISKGTRVYSQKEVDHMMAKKDRKFNEKFNEEVNRLLVLQTKKRDEEFEANRRAQQEKENFFDNKEAVEDQTYTLKDLLYKNGFKEVIDEIEQDKEMRETFRGCLKITNLKRAGKEEGYRLSYSSNVTALGKLFLTMLEKVRNLKENKLGGLGTRTINNIRGKKTAMGEVDAITSQTEASYIEEGMKENQII